MLSTAWIHDEFSSADFGDARLKTRFAKVTESMSQKPQQSIWQANKSWADAKGAYRLFSNEGITTKKIIDSHISMTKQRSQIHDTVLVIQDSSHISFNHRPQTPGLGPIGVSRNLNEVHGLMMHTSFALSPSGEPLGILAQDLWAREKKAVGKRVKKTERDKYVKRKQGTQIKESSKWLNQVKHYGEERKTSKQRWVTICDREADIYEFLRDCREWGSDFIIRASHNRSVNKSSRRSADHSWLWPHMCGLPIIGTYNLEASKTGYDEDLEVVVSISKVTISAPTSRTVKSHGNNLQNIEVTAVYVRETQESEERDPLSWMLLTSLPVVNFDGAFVISTWYGFRWEIEIFHKILKSGCSIEKCQLRSGERLKKYISLMSVIAWRILWMTRVQDKYADQSCEIILQENEWKALSCKMNGKPKPAKKPPTVSEAMRAIAKLGGFMGRASDGKPGFISIWRGWTKLFELSEYYLLFNSG